MPTYTLSGTCPNGYSSQEIARRGIPVWTDQAQFLLKVLTAPASGPVRFDWHLLRSSDNTICSTGGFYFGSPTSGQTHSETVQPGDAGHTWNCTNWDTLVLLGATDPGTTGSIELDVTDAATIPYCQYGTEANPDANVDIAVGSGLIDTAVALALGLTGQVELIPFVETALAAIEGSLAFGVDCSTLPPPAEPLDLTDPTVFQPEKMLQWFKNAVWHFYCQCTPAPTGSPDPVTPVPPVVIAPPNTPGTQTPEVCDNGDICSTLNQMQQTLAAILAQLSYGRRDVQIFQRNANPFAYINGTLHTGLVGVGTLAVADLVGVVTTATTIPAGISSDMATPTDYFVLGHLSFGTADGWSKSVRITHNPHLMLPIGSEVTQIAYTLRPGVTINLQELLPEPIG